MRLVLSRKYQNPPPTLHNACEISYQHHLLPPHYIQHTQIECNCLLSFLIINLKMAMNRHNGDDEPYDCTLIFMYKFHSPTNALFIKLDKVSNCTLKITLACSYMSCAVIGVVYVLFGVLSVIVWCVYCSVC